MDFDRIASSAPVNRTAAIVAAGTRCQPSDTPLDRRANLVRIVKQLDKALKATEDAERRKFLGARKLEVQNVLAALPRHVPKGRDLSGYIADVAKERLPRAVFNSIVEEASRRFDAAQKSAEPEAA